MVAVSIYMVYAQKNPEGRVVSCERQKSRLMRDNDDKIEISEFKFDPSRAFSLKRVLNMLPNSRHDFYGSVKSLKQSCWQSIKKIVSNWPCTYRT